MAEMAIKTGVAARNKFTSELDISDPADRAELTRRVFGNEEGENRGQLSEWSIKNGKTSAGHLHQHLLAIEKNEGKEAGDAARDRIRTWQRSGGQPVTV